MDPKHLRIVFLGTPEFAVGSLKALVENGYHVVGTITAPDKPSGRGLKISQPAVKKYAAEKGLPVLQPEKLKNPEFLAELNRLKPDLQIVVAFRMLPEAVWALPQLGTFNLHASLLPQYRGAAPLNWVIINGEQETGVTTFLLSHEIDTGRILFSEKESITRDDTFGDLHDRLMVKGARLVLKTVDALASGEIVPLSQENLSEPGKVLKTAPKLVRGTMQIDWTQPAEKIRNLIRGLSPHPAAWTAIRKNYDSQPDEIKIFSVETEQAATGIASGTIRSDGKNFLKIACGDGWINIKDLQLSGKKRMKVDELLRGFKEPEKYITEKKY
jgi:methionyl-tRNA formyltransferase